MISVAGIWKCTEQHNKFCACHLQDGGLGRLTMTRVVSDSYSYECECRLTQVHFDNGR